MSTFRFNNFCFTKSIYIIFIVIGFSCSKKKIDSNSKSEIVIIIHSDSKGTTTIFTTESIKYIGNNIKTSNHQNDTLFLNVRPIDILVVWNPTIFADTILVEKGDSIYLNFIGNKYSKLIIRNNSRISSSLPYYDEFKSTFCKNRKLDSLEGLFFQVDYSNPYSFSTDLVKYVDYKLLLNKKMIDRGELVMQELVREKMLSYENIENVKSIKIPYNYFYLYKELYKQKLFEDFYKYTRICKYGFLKDVMLSNFFLGNYALDSSYSLDYLKTILFGGIIFCRNQTYYGLYNEVDSYIKDTLLQKYARLLCLREMVNENSPDFKRTFDKFKIDYRDEYLNKYLSNRLKDYGFAKSTNFELILYGNIEKPVNYDSIILNNEKDVIYVDFWASWCAPCRQAMPSAKKIREEYRGKNVKFVYISLDKNIKSWENGINQCELNDNAINYLATNFEKSNIYKDLKINSIPRYLIYKDGVLLESHAPGPESKDIRKLLDKYLKK
ncbi:MAG: TlpA family protein disulfide reductase [Bacteroidales bacterium]|nr:TlpA family protein disulfide reductase [Bacteroidales bacterium]